MSYSFSAKSKSRLDTCHEDLSKIFELAIKRSKIDFGVAEGHRSVERQQELFNSGKSKIDGVNKKGKHNYNPSLAIDIYVYFSDPQFRKDAYDFNHLCYIAGIVESCALELLEKGEITHSIRWGGNWDGDGVIVLDQRFDDLVHFELV